DRFRKPSGSRNMFAFAGRHSLAVYLLHQPILIALVYGFSLVFPPQPINQVENYKANCNATCVQTNDAGLCERFCGCTLELLQARNLFDPMIEEKLSPPQQSQIEDLAQECQMMAN